MRAPLIIAALLAISGCGTSDRSTSPFGYFNPVPVPEFDQYLAEDAAKKLTALLPPATTKLDLLQPCQDAFGKSFVSLLRAKGYAVQESTNSTADKQERAPATASSSNTALGSIPINYLLDTIDTPVLYRLTLRIGDQSLSRAYQPQGASIHPASAWIRRE